MDLFEELARLKVEKAMATIEVAARKIAEPGERLQRRVEFLEDVTSRMFEAALEIERYGDRRDAATSEADREEASDRLGAELDLMGDAIEHYADEIVDEAKEERK